jgi:hypothetical protein
MLQPTGAELLSHLKFTLNDAFHGSGTEQSCRPSRTSAFCSFGRDWQEAEDSSYSRELLGNT